MLCYTNKLPLNVNVNLVSDWLVWQFVRSKSVLFVVVNVVVVFLEATITRVRRFVRQVAIWSHKAAIPDSEFEMMHFRAYFSSVCCFRLKFNKRVNELELWIKIKRVRKRERELES